MAEHGQWGYLTTLKRGQALRSDGVVVDMQTAAIANRALAQLKIDEEKSSQLTKISTSGTTRDVKK